jgi:hypothetical protein
MAEKIRRSVVDFRHLERRTVRRSFEVSLGKFLYFIIIDLHTVV